MKGRIFDVLELKNNRFRITMDVEGNEGGNRGRKQPCKIVCSLVPPK